MPMINDLFVKPLEEPTRDKEALNEFVKLYANGIISKATMRDVFPDMFDYENDRYEAIENE